MTLMTIDHNYLEMINSFPLVEIINDGMHKNPLAVLNKPVGKKHTAGQIAYLKVLTTLVDQYERSKFPAPKMSPARNNQIIDGI